MQYIWGVIPVVPGRTAITTAKMKPFPNDKVCKQAKLPDRSGDKNLLIIRLCMKKK